MQADTKSSDATPAVEPATKSGDLDLLVTSSASDTVLRYDGTTGAFLGQVLAPGAQGIDRPLGLAIDNEGDLYVTGRDSDSFVKVANGVATLLVAPGAGGLQAPAGLTIDPAGNVLVAHLGAGRAVVRFDGQTGAYLGTVVSAGDGGISADLRDVLMQPEPCEPDVNGDVVLNILDFVALQALFQVGCPG